MITRTDANTGDVVPGVDMPHSYMDWPAVLAGSVIATAIASVFSAFGLALGLAILSPEDGEKSVLAALIAVALWMLWTTGSSFMAGGYIAGRMRRRIGSATPHEAGVRDAIHGLTVWAVAVIIGIVLLGMAAGKTASVVADGATAIAQIAAPEISNAVAAPTDPAASPAAETDSAATIIPEMSEADAKALAAKVKAYSVLSAFVTAAALLIAGAGACWAASLGGRHRDEGFVSDRFSRWG